MSEQNNQIDTCPRCKAEIVSKFGNCIYCGYGDFE